MWAAGARDPTGHSPRSMTPTPQHNANRPQVTSHRRSVREDECDFSLIGLQLATQFWGAYIGTFAVWSAAEIAGEIIIVLGRSMSWGLMGRLWGNACVASSTQTTVQKPESTTMLAE